MSTWITGRTGPMEKVCEIQFFRCISFPPRFIHERTQQNIWASFYENMGLLSKMEIVLNFAGQTDFGPCFFESGTFLFPVLFTAILSYVHHWLMITFFNQNVII